MTKQRRTLFFGPYPPPVTGQSIAFKEVFDNYAEQKILCNSVKYGDNRLLNTLYCFYKVSYLFSRYRFDKVYFTCTRSNFGFFKDFILLLFCKLFNKKVINHLHGADFKSFYNQSGVLKPLIKWSYSSIHVTIILLSAMKDQFDDFPWMDTVAVSNAYSLEYEQEEINLADKKSQLLYLSNLIESKGILVFVNIIKKIFEEHANVIVKIAGSYMADELSNSKVIEQKFLRVFSPLKSEYPDRIFFLGSITGEYKKEILRESSILVLPTFYKTEAFPLTIIEAMRFGNAIITTKHNYLEHILGPDNGFLVETHCPADLFDKINALLNNKQQLYRMQQNNILGSKSKYNPALYIHQVSHIINTA